MDFSLMNLMHSCRCCLRCPPDKELTTPYIHQGKTEIYSHMLEECFKIPLVLGGSGSSGICSVCVDRLRDALNFKMQVEWCQAELQEWLQGESDEDEAELDMYSPSSPVDERRSPSRALIRSRSRSPLTSRGHARSPSPSWSKRPRSRPRSRSRSRPRSLQRSRPRSRPRSRSRSRPRSLQRSRPRSRPRSTPRHNRGSNLNIASSRSRVTDRSRASSRSKASRRKRHSRSSSRAPKRRRSRSHSPNRRASRRSRSRESHRPRSQASNQAPSLQLEKRSEAEQRKPIEDTITTTDSDSNALKTARNDSVDKEGNEQNVPEFDPSNRQQNITMWLRKVNVCAAINGWSERQLIHYALPKLKGLAQMWYEGLPSVLFSWKEWQAKLLAAFPPKENYGQMLLAMISRRVGPGDSLEDYYYDKVALINRVSEPITGRLAVECVLHGIDDLSIRLGAEAAQFCDLDNLLSYLRNVQPVSNLTVNNTTQEFTFQSTDSKPDKQCVNCKQEGHEPKQCPLPLKICTICGMVGHEAGHEQCYTNLQNPVNLEMDGVFAMRGHKKCRNCKQKGHSPAWCPLPTRRCTKCQRVGHLAEQCYANIQNPEILGMGGVSFEPFHGNTTVKSLKFCRNCKQQGHKSAQCPLPIKKCTKCQKIGHLSEQCYKNVQNNSADMDGVSSKKTHKKIKCFNCKQEGHMLAKCTMPIIKCNRCEKVGHVADQCDLDIQSNSLEDSELHDESLEPYIDNTKVGKSIMCHKCKQLGHVAGQCTVIVKKCTICLKKGHVAEKCFKNIRNSSLKDVLKVDGASSEPNIVEKPIWCYNCKKKGHLDPQCTLPIKKCLICSYLGHEADTCRRKPTTDTNS